MIRKLLLFFLGLSISHLTLAQAPPNDDPCNAEPLTVNATCTFSTYTNFGATDSAPLGVPAPGCAFYLGGDVWFSFTVPAGGVVVIDSNTGVITDSGMAIYSGTCGSLTLLECDDDGSANGAMSSITRSGLTPGDTIFIRFWEYFNDNNGTFDICVSEPPPPPANDDPCNAEPLTVNTPCTFSTYTNENATDSAGLGVPAPGCGFYSGGDVWFSVVVPASGSIVIDSDTGVVTDSGMAIYSGTCGTLALLECDDNDSANGNMSSITRTGLTPGDTVFIRFWEYGNNNNGTFDICVSEPPPAPANDDPCNAEPLTVNATCTYSTYTTESATDSAGVPAPGCAFYQGGDVWFSVTVPAVGGLIIDSTQGVITDSGMAIYSGTCGSLTLIECDDDGSTNGAMSSITRTGLTPGDTIYIRFWEYGNNNNGTFGICVSEPPPPPANDEPCNAVSLTPDLACNDTSGTIESATDSGINACTGTPNDDVWYSFVATDTTHFIQISNVVGTSTNLNHAVYGGFTAPDCTVTVGDNISCSDPNSSNVTGLIVGQTYFVQVYSSGSSSVNTTFDICIVRPCQLPTVVTTPSCTFVDVTPNTGSIGACGSGATETLTADFLNLGDTSDYTADLITYDATAYTNFEAAATSPVALVADDRWSNVAYTIPFDFCYYGNSATQIVIGANGAISFNTALANTASGFVINNNLPSTTGTALVDNTIYAAYQDLDPSVSGSISYGTTSVNGCNAFVVHWEEIPLWDNGNFGDNTKRQNVIAVLYENTNIIEILIEEKDLDDVDFAGDPWNDGNAIVGIQNTGATLATVAPCRNALDDNWATSNEAWRFTPRGTSITDLQWLVNGTPNPAFDGLTSITVSPTTTTTYTAQVTYSWCNGTTSVLTDDTVVSVGGGAKIWDGSEATNDWMEPLNWSGDIIPDDTDCVVIPVTGNDPVLYDNDNGDGLNLTIEDGATLTLSTDTDANNFASSLTIQDWIDIQGNGQLIIENDASLIQVYDSSTVTPPSASNSGNIALYRNTDIRNTDYVYWSSPVAGFDISNVYGAFTPTDFIYEWIPTVASPFTGPPPGNVPVIVGDWNAINSGTMSQGKGYIVRGPTNHTTTVSTATAIFDGVPNNGVITQSLSSGNYSGTSFTYNPYGVDVLTVTEFDDNWNLLGNPYPSAIDAQTFLTHTNNSIIEGAVHIWTHGSQLGTYTDSFYDDFLLTYNINDYITYNFSGTNTYANETFGGKIASGQGFFVLALNDNETGSVTFNNAMRDRTHSNTDFYRTSEPSGDSANIERHRIWLNLVDETGNTSNILVGYIEGATQDKDRLYDAYTRETSSLNMYSIINNERMVIQGRALPFDINDEVPLGTVLPDAGQYTIAIDNVDGLFTDNGQNIYLEDNYLNVIHDLKTAPYSFNVSSEIDYNDRFILRFTNETLSVIDFELKGLTIMAPGGDYIKVNSENNPIESVIVYDILGRILFDEKNIISSEYVIENHNLSDGAYIVKATLVNGVSKIQKIVLED